MLQSGSPDTLVRGSSHEDVNTISVSDSRHVGDSDFYELKEFNDIQKIKKEKYNYDSKIRYVLIHSVTND